MISRRNLLRAGLIAPLLLPPFAKAQFNGALAGFNPGGFGLFGGTLSRDIAPSFAVPTGGTFYVSGATPSILPAGSDANPGTLAAPFATLAFALTQIPASGDFLVLCDGTFAENNASRLILNRPFLIPVLFDSYSGNANNFIITNAAGTAGVITVRGNFTGSNTQFRRATIRSSTDGNSVFVHNPSTSAIFGINIGFFDCIIEGRTQSVSTIPVISILTDIALSGLAFVRTQFKRTVGASTTVNPVLITTSPTQSINNQPYSNIGFWDCSFTDNQWFSFSQGFAGIAGVTIVRSSILTNGNYGILIGRDSSGDTTAKCTDVYISANNITAIGSNPHGILIGSNVMGALVKDNTLSTLLQGIVTKGCFDTVALNNNLTMTPNAAIPSGLYAKASTRSKFHNNTLTMDGSAFQCRAFSENIDVANKASSTELIGNIINASGINASAIFWVDGTGSTGGANCNNNDIRLTNSATLGSVRGLTVANLAAMQAAWISNGLAGDLPTNDSLTIVH